MGTEETIIRPEYSAVAAKDVSKPSRATQAAIEVLKEANATNIAEIGCGLLANTPHLLKAFPVVVLVDTKDQYIRIQHKIADLSNTYSSFKAFIDTEPFQEREMQLDGAIIINVLHILSEVSHRLQLLASGYRNLRENGLVFIDVPYNEAYYRNQVKTARAYNDGYIMRRPGNYYTFYKNMNFDELKNYAERVGFQFEKRIYLDHRVTFTCRKKSKD